MTPELPKTRAEALAANSPLYRTSKPCIHGHLSPRYASGGTCVACNADRSNRKWIAIGDARVKLKGQTLLLKLPAGMSIQIGHLPQEP